MGPRATTMDADESERNRTGRQRADPYLSVDAGRVAHRTGPFEAVRDEGSSRSEATHELDRHERSLRARRPRVRRWAVFEQRLSQTLFAAAGEDGLLRLACCGFTARTESHCSRRTRFLSRIR